LPAELDACVQSVLAKSPELDESNAYAICNAQLGGANFVSYELNRQGDLYLKYFLADSTFAKNTHVGDFSLNGAALAAKDKEAIGIPFVVLPTRDLSLFGDYHAWSPMNGATYDDHINFAKRYSPGEIVAVTPHSMQGAAQAVTNNGGRFAIVKITDQRARQAYIDNPNLIPKAVSPGIINMEAPNKENISDFKWAHLAAVPQGAYGSKATLYGSCLGGNTECVNRLVAASVFRKATITNYCPVGASESLANTSLINSGTSFSKMSANTDSTTSTNIASPTTTPQTTTTAAPQNKAPIQAPIEKKPGVLRLKTQKPLTPEEEQLKQQQGQLEQQKTPDLSKMEEVEKRLAEIEQREQLNERLGHVRELIDTRLFVTKGKYDQKAHEAAIQEAANSQWTDEQLSKYYGGLLRIKLFEEANDPKNRNNQFNNQLPGMPATVPLFGGSYQTPSSVPELMGASAETKDMDLDTFRIMKVKQLAQMFHLGDRL
jgi:hypothetical protein